jgi:orotate phosphoribosyltransferase
MSDVVEILKKLGAVITDDHFVYTSGKHGEIYINKDALYPHPVETSEVGKTFAEKYKDMEIDVVAAPALGGIILSTWTSYHLTQMKGKEILGVYAEKMPDKSMVIEDLTTTGGSVKKVVDLVRATGGEVVAVCVMVNRDPDTVNSEFIGAPFDSLGVLKAQAWDEAELPENIKSRPVNVNVGHGKKYMDAKAAEGNA